MPEFTGTNDLRAYVRILWRWRLLFLFFLVAAPLAAYLIERSQQPVYQSSALVGVSQTTVNTSLVTNGGGSFTTTNVTAIARLVTTTPVADVAARLLHPPANPAAIAGAVKATGDTTTNFLTITAQDRSPRRAANIANAFAHAIGARLQVNAIAQIDTAVRSLRAQLARLGPHDPARGQLEQQLTQLAATRSTQGSDAAILQPATPAGAPVGLNTRRAVEIGLLIGLILAIGAVVLAENADRRLRSPHDLEATTELPLLAAIAPSSFSGTSDMSPEDVESFHMLRMALTYFNLDERSQPNEAASTGLRSILITSPGEQEGKTTVATKLAIVTAEAGMRVMLIDGDLRRAQVAPRFQIEQQEGLGAVLAGERSLDQVLVDYPVDDTSGRLIVLPAGPLPPRPAVLIDSPAMRHVLTEAESRNDLVIIDSPAALAMSDPVALMRLVSGVVLVARMGRSTRQAVRRLQRIVEAAGGKPVGVVATGVTSALGYEYYSPKYYTQNGARGTRRARGSAKAHAGEQT